MIAKEYQSMTTRETVIAHFTALTSFGIFLKVLRGRKRLINTESNLQEVQVMTPSLSSISFATRVSYQLI